MAWDAQQYLKFEHWRRRPAQDLLAAAVRSLAAASCAPGEPRQVVDLGCGAGGLARQAARQWPQARITGVDSSSSMLERAAAVPSSVTWIRADIRAWSAETPPDLLLSNAALHWLSPHAELFPRLVAGLAPNGLLAVQMPRNFDRPSHTLVWSLAAESHWRDRLPSFFGQVPVAEPAAYHQWLSPVAHEIDIWETDYLQVLEGEQPVLEWLKGTTLVPVAETLNAGDFHEFLAELGVRLSDAYPPTADGKTFFTFRRLFILARR